MIRTVVSKMVSIVNELLEDINADIADVKSANHENLLDRNDSKLEKMEKINSYKQELNTLLAQAIENGEDVNQYRDDVDALESKLLELSNLNNKLAAIVLPVKEMYKEIIEDISYANGGSAIEVRA
jgi:outer membrane murein-binding lipoprotein Lpp